MSLNLEPTLYGAGIPSTVLPTPVTTQKPPAKTNVHEENISDFSTFAVIRSFEQLHESFCQQEYLWKTLMTCYVLQKIYQKRLLLMNIYSLISYQLETLATWEIILLMLIRFRQVIWKSCSAFTIRSRFAVQNFPHIFCFTPCFCIIHQHKISNFFSSNFLCLKFAYFHKSVSTRWKHTNYFSNKKKSIGCRSPTRWDLFAERRPIPRWRYFRSRFGW